MPQTLARNVQLLVLDVDGVLTDGSILIDDLGHETKRFHVHDGFAMKLWQQLGYALAVITSRTGRAARHRLAELGVEHVAQGVSDKAVALERLLERTGLAPEQTAYLGDDWPDLAAMRRVAYPMAVADAAPEVIRAAVFITARPGGRGAVRDAVEHLLGLKGRMEEARRQYDPHL